MDNQVLSVLLRIKEEYGANVFGKNGKIKAYLDDFLPASEMKRTKTLIVSAINDIDAYFAIKEASEETRGFIIERLISQMNEDYGFNREYAKDTVWLIAGVLGYDSPEKNSENIVEKSSPKTSEPAGTIKKAQYYNNIGLDYYQKKSYDDAVANYTIAIDIDSKFTEAYLNRADVYFEQENYDLAIKDYNKAIRYNPLDAETHCNRGITYVKKRNFDLAVDDFILFSI